MGRDWPDDLENIEELRGRTGVPGARGYPSSLGDLIKSYAELAALLADPIFWSSYSGRREKDTMLVLPGYSCTDLHTLPLRYWLRRNGFRPRTSGIASIPAWSEATVEFLCRRAKSLAHEVSGGIAIIGHSMGAIYGWSIARRIPELVRHLVPLGAPLASAGSILPERVRITAIYTPDRETQYADSPAREPHAQNFQVRGSHGGLIVNRHVYRILSSAL